MKRYFTSLAVLLLMLPFSGAVYLLVNNTNIDIAFVDKERTGVTYHKELLQIMLHMHDYSQQLLFAETYGGNSSEISKNKDELIITIGKVGISTSQYAQELGLERESAMSLS